MLLSPHEFEQLVEEALAKLPARFAKLLENIAVVVEEEPSAGDLDEVFGDDEEGDDELLGIFRGTPLTQRRFDDLPQLPAEVAIFRGPILRVSRNRREAVHEIRETVIHELGHYFGLGDHEMVF
ncbi:MAG TPA: metallopeptidase family protein [Thermoanaerobaculia bacterium]|jgi:predicted Zn-dependent protease with MMP-like domain|nr:metallopeptidase family protein [Thermoanaerobaculia bacterium]